MADGQRRATSATAADDESPPGEPARLVVTSEVLARTVRDLADAVVVCDRSGVILFWNLSAARIFGWSGQEALGQSLDLIIPERLRSRHWSGWTETMERGTTEYGERLLEVPAVHRSGARLSIAFTVTLLFSPQRPGVVAGVVAVIRDQTSRWNERRALEAEVRELRAADSVSSDQ